MMTADALLWRVKYFLLLVLIFAAASFLPPGRTHASVPSPAPAADAVITSPTR